MCDGCNSYFLIWAIDVILIFFILGYFFALLPPNNPKNQNLKEMKKNTWRYHHFTHVYQK